MLKLINASHITDDLAQHSAPTTNNSHTIRLVIMEDTKDDQEECVPRAASTRACLLVQWGLAAGDLVYGLCRPLPVKLQTPHYTPPAGLPLAFFLARVQPHRWLEPSRWSGQPLPTTHSHAIVTGTNKDTHNTNKVGVPRSPDRPVGFCCEGSGVPPLLPTPSEVADASRHCVSEPTFLMAKPKL